MKINKCLAALVVASIAMILLVLHLFRYEYADSKVSRVDRLTGYLEFYCVDEHIWVVAREKCGAKKSNIANEPKADANKNAQSKSGVDLPTSTKAIRSHYQCLDQDEYIRRSEAKGMKCTGRAENHIICGHDKNSDGLIEPWEMKWHTKEEASKCPKGYYILED